MTVIACLLAFIAGLLVGWLGLRAIGWLCFFCLLPSAWGAYPSFTVVNAEAISVTMRGYSKSNPDCSGGSALFDGPYNLSPGQSCTMYIPDQSSSGGYSLNDSQGHECCLGARSTIAGTTYYMQAGCGNAPPGSNYCYACASWGPNPCLQAATVTVVEAGANATRNDGNFAVLPGQTFTLCATNTDMVNYCPFQLILSVTSDCRDPVTVTANSTYGSMNSPGQGNNNPQTGGGGNNTTNAPTGSGGTNVANIDSINALIRQLELGFGLLDGDLKMINGNILPLAKENTLRGVTNQLGQVRSSLSNLATEATSLSISNLLSQLTNAAAAHSNVFLAPMIAFTNFIGTNGYEGVSNTVLGEATATSNLWNYAVNTRASGIWALTNAIATPDAGDEDVWKYSFTNAISNSKVEMDLNPMHSRAAFVFDWVKLGLKFFAQIAVFLYMLNRIEDAWVKLLHTPGAGVGKMNPLMSLPLWFKSNALFVTLVLAIIVFGTGALDTFLSNTGGWWSNPFSSAVVTGMSTNARYVKGALIIIEGMIPIAELCLLIVLTTIFDLLLTGHIMFWSVMTRRLAE